MSTLDLRWTALIGIGLLLGACSPSDGGGEQAQSNEVESDTGADTGGDKSDAETGDVDAGTDAFICDPDEFDELQFVVGYHVDDWLEYSLHVEVEPRPLDDDIEERFSAGNYEMTELEDGTWLVEGETGTADPSGPMYGDSYEWMPDEECVLGWEADRAHDEYVVRINGEEIDPALLPALDLDVEPEPDPEPDPAACDGDEADFIESVDPCLEDGQSEPLPFEGPVPIGGGPDYENRVCEDDANTVVSTFDGLETALAEASAGEVVFVDPDAEIDMGYDADLDVPSGVTLSGGRGCDCRRGALLYTDEIVEDDYDHETMLRPGDDARITGLRMRGPRTPCDWIEFDDMDYYLDGKAIGVAGTGVEIDNNELWGFAHAGVSAGDETHLHHNHIHNMVRDGLGYGVTGGDDVLIEYNYFDWTRHAVASGERNSYEARYNHVGKHAISHIFDMHLEGGETVEIYRNTVESVEHGLKSKNTPAVVIRGTPSNTADIYDNWFFNPKEPRDEPIDQWTDEAIVQMHVTEWTNLEFWNNQYGQTDPDDCQIGAPREGCPAP